MIHRLGADTTHDYNRGIAIDKDLLDAINAPLPPLRVKRAPIAQLPLKAGKVLISNIESGKRLGRVRRGRSKMLF
jgi:hypothetical protein